MTKMKLTVIIPTYAPNAERFRLSLKGMATQCLADKEWELIVIDNASPIPVSEVTIRESFSGNFRLFREETPGLSHARHRGIVESTTDLLVFSDDDNVFAPSYLTKALELMSTHPKVGVAGGKSLPKFEAQPPNWYIEGMAPLGCRDLGKDALTLTGEEYATSKLYPEFAPIGAGMIFRKEAVCTWMETVKLGDVPDRKGNSLSSAGDCDMVLHALDAGWSAAYWPDFSLHHLLPETRLTKSYLGAISRAAYRDYIKVLDRHGIRPWNAIAPWTLPLRKSKAWLRNRPWSSPGAFVRWNSAAGNLEGRASLKG